MQLLLRILTFAAFASGCNTAALAEEITVPFDPPVDVPLVYRVTIERADGDRMISSVAEQRHTFARAPGGYILAVDTSVVSRTGPPDVANAPLAMQAQEQLESQFASLQFDMAEDGTIVRVRDWGAVREKIATIPAYLATGYGIPDDDPRFRAMLDHFLQPVLALSAEEAVPLVLRAWDALYGYGGVTLDSATPLTGSFELPSPYFEEPVGMTGTTAIFIDERGRIGVRSQSEPTDVAALVTEVLSSAVGDAVVDQSAMQRGIAGLRLTDTIDVRFDKSAGTIDVGVIQRSTQLPNRVSRVERTKVERIG